MKETFAIQLLCYIVAGMYARESNFVLYLCLFVILKISGLKLCVQLCKWLNFVENTDFDKKL